MFELPLDRADALAALGTRQPDESHRSMLMRYTYGKQGTSYRPLTGFMTDEQAAEALSALVLREEERVLSLARNQPTLYADMRRSQRNHDQRLGVAKAQYVRFTFNPADHYTTYDMYDAHNLRLRPNLEVALNPLAVPVAPQRVGVVLPPQPSPSAVERRMRAPGLAI